MNQDTEWYKQYKMQPWGNCRGTSNNWSSYPSEAGHSVAQAQRSGAVSHLQPGPPGTQQLTSGYYQKNSRETSALAFQVCPVVSGIEQHSKVYERRHAPLQQPYISAYEAQTALSTFQTSGTQQYLYPPPQQPYTSGHTAELLPGSSKGQRTSSSYERNLTETDQSISQVRASTSGLQQYSAKSGQRYSYSSEYTAGSQPNTSEIQLYTLKYNGRVQTKTDQSASEPWPSSSGTPRYCPQSMQGYVQSQQQFTPNCAALSQSGASRTRPSTKTHQSVPEQRSPMSGTQQYSTQSVQRCASSEESAGSQCAPSEAQAYTSGLQSQGAQSTTESEADFSRAERLGPDILPSSMYYLNSFNTYRLHPGYLNTPYFISPDSQSFPYPSPPPRRLPILHLPYKVTFKKPFIPGYSGNNDPNAVVHLNEHYPGTSFNHEVKRELMQFARVTFIPCVPLETPQSRSDTRLPQPLPIAPFLSTLEMCPPSSRQTQPSTSGTQRPTTSSGGRPRTENVSSVKREQEDTKPFDQMGPSDYLESPDDLYRRFFLKLHHEIMAGFADCYNEHHFVARLRRFKDFWDQHADEISLRLNLIRLLKRYLLVISQMYVRIGNETIPEYLEVMEDLLVMFSDIVKDGLHLRKEEHQAFFLNQHAVSIIYLACKCLFFRMDSITHFLLKVRIFPADPMVFLMWTYIYIFFMDKLRYHMTRDDLCRCFLLWQKYMDLRANCFGPDEQLEKLMLLRLRRLSFDEFALDSPLLREFVTNKKAQGWKYGYREMITRYFRWFKTDRLKERDADMCEATTAYPGIKFREVSLNVILSPPVPRLRGMARFVADYISGRNLPLYSRERFETEPFDLEAYYNRIGPPRLPFPRPIGVASRPGVFEPTLSRSCEQRIVATIDIDPPSDDNADDDDDDVIFVGPIIFGLCEFESLETQPEVPRRIPDAILDRLLCENRDYQYHELFEPDTEEYRLYHQFIPTGDDVPVRIKCEFDPTEIIEISDDSCDVENSVERLGKTRKMSQDSLQSDYVLISDIPKAAQDVRSLAGVTTIVPDEPKKILDNFKEILESVFQVPTVDISVEDEEDKSIVNDTSSHEREAAEEYPVQPCGRAGFPSSSNIRATSSPIGVSEEAEEISSQEHIYADKQKIQQNKLVVKEILCQDYLSTDKKIPIEHPEVTDGFDRESDDLKEKQDVELTREVSSSHIDNSASVHTKISSIAKNSQGNKSMIEDTREVPNECTDYFKFMVDVTSFGGKASSEHNRKKSREVKKSSVREEKGFAVVEKIQKTPYRRTDISSSSEARIDDAKLSAEMVARSTSKNNKPIVEVGQEALNQDVTSLGEETPVVPGRVRKRPQFKLQDSKKDPDHTTIPVAKVCSGLNAEPSQAQNDQSHQIDFFDWLEQLPERYAYSPEKNSEEFSALSSTCRSSPQRQADTFNQPSASTRFPTADSEVKFASASDKKTDKIDSEIEHILRIWRQTSPPVMDPADERLPYKKVTEPTDARASITMKEDAIVTEKRRKRSRAEMCKEILDTKLCSPTPQKRRKERHVKKSIAEETECILRKYAELNQQTMAQTEVAKTMAETTIEAPKQDPAEVEETRPKASRKRTDPVSAKPSESQQDENRDQRLVVADTTELPDESKESQSSDEHSTGPGTALPETPEHKKETEESTTLPEEPRRQKDTESEENTAMSVKSKEVESGKDPTEHGTILPEKPRHEKESELEETRAMCVTLKESQSDKYSIEQATSLEEEPKQKNKIEPKELTVVSVNVKERESDRSIFGTFVEAKQGETGKAKLETNRTELRTRRKTTRKGKTRPQKIVGLSCQLKESLSEDPVTDTRAVVLEEVREGKATLMPEEGISQDDKPETSRDDKPATRKRTKGDQSEQRKSTIVPAESEYEKEGDAISEKIPEKSEENQGGVDFNTEPSKMARKKVGRRSRVQKIHDDLSEETATALDEKRRKAQHKVEVRQSLVVLVESVGHEPSREIEPLELIAISSQEALGSSAADKDSKTLLATDDFDKEAPQVAEEPLSTDERLSYSDRLTTHQELSTNNSQLEILEKTDVSLEQNKFADSIDSLPENVVRALSISTETPNAEAERDLRNSFNTGMGFNREAVPNNGDRPEGKENTIKFSVEEQEDSSWNDTTDYNENSGTTKEVAFERLDFEVSLSDFTETENWWPKTYGEGVLPSKAVPVDVEECQGSTEDYNVAKSQRSSYSEEPLAFETLDRNEVQQFFDERQKLAASSSETDTSSISSTTASDTTVTSSITSDTTPQSSPEKSTVTTGANLYNAPISRLLGFVPPATNLVRQECLAPFTTKEKLTEVEIQAETNEEAGSPPEPLSPSTVSSSKRILADAYSNFAKVSIETDEDNVNVQDPPVTNQTTNSEIMIEYQSEKEVSDADGVASLPVTLLLTPSQEFDQQQFLSDPSSYQFAVQQRPDTEEISGSQTYSLRSSSSTRIANAISTQEEGNTAILYPSSPTVAQIVVPDIVQEGVPDIVQEDVSHNEPAVQRNITDVPAKVLRIASPQNINPAPVTTTKNHSVTFFEEKTREIYAKEFGNKLDAKRYEDPPSRGRKRVRKSSPLKESTEADRLFKPYSQPKRKDQKTTQSKSLPSSKKVHVTAENNDLFQNGIEGPMGKPLRNCGGSAPNMLWDGIDEPSKIGTISMKADSQLFSNKNEDLVSILKKPKPKGEFEFTKRKDRNDYKVPSALDPSFFNAYIKIKRSDIVSGSLIQRYKKARISPQDLEEVKRQREVKAAHDRALHRARMMELKEQQVKQETGILYCIFADKWNRKAKGLFPNAHTRKVRFKGDTEDDYDHRNHRNGQGVPEKRKRNDHPDEIPPKKSRISVRTDLMEKKPKGVLPDLIVTKSQQRGDSFVNKKTRVGTVRSSNDVDLEENGKMLPEEEVVGTTRSGRLRKRPTGKDYYDLTESTRGRRKTRFT